MKKTAILFLGILLVITVALPAYAGSNYRGEWVNYNHSHGGWWFPFTLFGRPIYVEPIIYVEPTPTYELPYSPPPQTTQPTCPKLEAIGKLNDGQTIYKCVK